MSRTAPKRLMRRCKGFSNVARMSPALLRGLEELNTFWTAFRQTRDTQLIPLIYEGKIEEAEALALGIQAERYLKFRSIAKRLGEEAEKKAETAVMQSEQRANQSVLILLTATAILGSVPYFNNIWIF